MLFYGFQRVHGQEDRLADPGVVERWPAGVEGHLKTGAWLLDQNRSSQRLSLKMRSPLVGPHLVYVQDAHAESGRPGCGVRQNVDAQAIQQRQTRLEVVGVPAE